MMQDYVRTGTYQRAILQNHSDFKDKVWGALGPGQDEAPPLGFWPRGPALPVPFPGALRAPQ